MHGIPFVLNRYVGPFLTGGLMAAGASAEEPFSGAVLFGIACVCGFVSLPGKDRFIARMLDGKA